MDHHNQAVDHVRRHGQFPAAEWRHTFGQARVGSLDQLDPAPFDVCRQPSVLDDGAPTDDDDPVDKQIGPAHLTGERIAD